MTTITIRVPEELKKRASLVSKENGVSLSEALRNTLEYMAHHHAMPVKKTWLSAEEDADLVALIQKREKSGKRIKVDFNDL